MDECACRYSLHVHTWIYVSATVHMQLCDNLTMYDNILITHEAVQAFLL